MSNKLEKLRASQAKDKERLETLQARLKAREEDIRVEERTEIIGIVEEIGMTPEQLAEHFADLLFITVTGRTVEQPVSSADTARDSPGNLIRADSVRTEGTHADARDTSTVT
jgi:hypothetical protein